MMRMRPLPQDYNGFSGPERAVGSRAQDAAKRRARGSWFVRRCSMCGLSKDNDNACVIGHLEDYAAPVDGVLPTCVECHERLHRRFAQPNVWARYVLALRRGYQPPPYQNILAFRARNSGRDVPPETVPPPVPPEPGRWWEYLLITPIDFRAGLVGVGGRVAPPQPNPYLVAPAQLGLVGAAR